MTWAANDLQISAFLDGGGWLRSPKGIYNTRMFSIGGGPRNAVMTDMPNYPDLIPVGRDPRYYGFGHVALGERIYQFLAAEQLTSTGRHWTGAKVIYLPDCGQTWRNADGASPVVWESYQERNSENMLFFNEPNSIFSLISVLQMGKGYRGNQDGYVYLYSTNGFSDGSMNQLVLARVEKARILQRRFYQFFAGMKANGSAEWTDNIEARAVVCKFPLGWVNTPVGPDMMVAQSWLPSVTYNASLGIYMMANWGDGCAPDGSWFGKPSYLGFWIAPKPWGPWSQIHEERAWRPSDDPDARCYSPQIAPKWIAPDGKSFWLVWTDFQGAAKLAAQLEEEGISPDTRIPSEQRRAIEINRDAMPYYAFNVQRVDLVLS